MDSRNPCSLFRVFLLAYYPSARGYPRITFIRTLFLRQGRVALVYTSLPVLLAQQTCVLET